MAFLINERKPSCRGAIIVDPNTFWLKIPVCPGQPCERSLLTSSKKVDIDRAKEVKPVEVVAVVGDPGLWRAMLRWFKCVP